VQVSIDDFKKVIEKEHSLTSGGVNSLLLMKSPKMVTLDERKESLKREREFLVSRFDEFRICCEWLSKLKKVKTPQYSSYFLKHVVEKLAGEYVCNGALIAAALHLKLPIKYNDGSPNVDVGISKKCPFLKKVGNVA